MTLLLEGIAPGLLAPPVNVLRLSMHPQGLSSRILNYAEWRAHVLSRIKRVARSRYLNYQSMIKQWLSERLEKEVG